MHEYTKIKSTKSNSNFVLCSFNLHYLFHHNQSNLITDRLASDLFETDWQPLNKRNPLSMQFMP
ncbi:hypothetical protein BpHYR1_035750 [Brachionus plicatilis]|uniref:Uncharacterized protein n=1 Tax=Brachionus plicatilis TaxID=10195 RepID=A0A3M7ST47_BRAPC|nr:hypothetical protein BpHYR1_035750 [Brachionus plicatilis]